MSWADANRVPLAKERLHYIAIRNLASNNDFNAIKYLYDRLNIIDAKAQGLLIRSCAYGQRYLAGTASKVKIPADINCHST